MHKVTVKLTPQEFREFEHKPWGARPQAKPKPRKETIYENCGNCGECVPQYYRWCPECRVTLDDWRSY